MASFASIPTAVAADEPRRLLRLPNSDADDTNHRILQSSSMSMATESMDTVGPNMEVIDAIVSKVEKEGEEVDPAALMLANLALVEFDESAMHHHGGYNYSEKCLKLLFILLPDYKASKLSFICGETITTSSTAASSTTTRAMTTSTTTAAMTTSTTTAGCFSIYSNVELSYLKSYVRIVCCSPPNFFLSSICFYSATTSKASTSSEESLMHVQ